MLPYGRQSIGDEDVDAVVAALRSDWLTTGPLVERFETELSKAAGVPHAVAVTSGTAALHTAYAAAGITSGDEVVTSPLTFVATAATAALLGASVTFADVDPDTGNLDTESTRAAITPRTRVVSGVDFAGLPVDAQMLRAIAHEHDALFLQDAAHSIGGRVHGDPVGAQADLTTFSFFPTKNLTTAEGGAVVTTDAELAARARAFKSQGLVRDKEQQRYPDEGPWHQEVHEFGINYRLPDVLCALGISQISKLDTFVRRRQHIHDRYNAAFADNPLLATPPCPEGVQPAWHLYPLRVPADQRKAMFEQLRARGIGVQVNYMPAYWHPVFEEMGYRRGLCPNAEQYYRQEISLPLYPALTDDQVDHVIEAVLDVAGT